MKKLSFFGLGALILMLAAGCVDNKDSGNAITLSPEMGTRFNSKQPVTIKVGLPADYAADSTVYLLDSVVFATEKGGAGAVLRTDTLVLGSRLITARVFKGGKAEEVSTNIMLYAEKAPEPLKFVVEKVFPHDTSSYTEGLVYENGYLYESDGGYVDQGEGRSSLRKVDIKTGKVLKIADVDPKVFAEGISIVGDKIIQLTYREKIGYVYNKNTFELLSTFNNNIVNEGWGLCFDGKKLYMNDGSNRIYFLDKDTYRQTGFIDVCDDTHPIPQVNEMEMIDGKLYANVYTTNDILVIDPKTGAVLQKADLTDLWPLKDRPAGFDSNDKVLNGIAWDAAGKRLFVTGKKWPHLYQIKLVAK